MSVESDVEILKKQVTHFLTDAQIRALIAAYGTDIQSLNTTIQALRTELTTLTAAVQNLKDEMANHETRLDDLEA